MCILEKVQYFASVHQKCHSMSEDIFQFNFSGCHHDQLIHVAELRFGPYTSYLVILVDREYNALEFDGQQIPVRISQECNASTTHRAMQATAVVSSSSCRAFMDGFAATLEMRATKFLTLL